VDDVFPDPKECLQTNSISKMKSISHLCMGLGKVILWAKSQNEKDTCHQIEQSMKHMARKRRQRPELQSDDSDQGARLEQMKHLGNI
jgi:hypothetical protein